MWRCLDRPDFGVFLQPRPNCLLFCCIFCVFVVYSYGYVTEADRSRDMDRERTNLCMDRLVVVENLFGVREQACFAAIDGHGMLVCACGDRLF